MTTEIGQISYRRYAIGDYSNHVIYVTPHWSITTWPSLKVLKWNDDAITHHPLLIINLTKPNMLSSELISIKFGMDVMPHMKTPISYSGGARFESGAREFLYRLGVIGTVLSLQAYSATVPPQKQISPRPPASSRLLSSPQIPPIIQQHVTRSTESVS